jgi:hypothetical protein
MITINQARDHGQRLLMPASAALAVREWKQNPSVIVTGGFVTDNNSTPVSAAGHRYRQ